MHRIGTATTFLPSYNQWFKAAFYDPSTESYFAYATSSDTAPVCTEAGATPDTANCDHVYVSGPTSVGGYTGSASPYGTFDQAGNLQEWTERLALTSTGDYQRRALGGDWSYRNYALSSTEYRDWPADTQNGQVGFRVASSVPEPDARALVVTSLIALLGLTRRAGRSRLS